MFTPGIITYSNLVPENIGNFERTDAFSVECWFYQTTAKTACLMQHMTYDSIKRGWMCNTWTFRNVGFLLCNQDVSPVKLLHVRTSSSQYLLNTWNHLIFTYNGSSLLTGIKCYINNVSKTLTLAGTNTLSDTIKSDDAKLMIGHNIAYQYFPGKIDEAVVYNRVLTATEVSQRYNAGAGTENLFGSVYLHYHLNELSGSIVSDSSGNLRNGITVGSPLWVAGKLNNCISLNGSSQYIQA